jgi:Fe-Mn family superoxide dismutase
MKYEATNFDHLLGTAGFSNQLLTTHFTLYKGYVTNTNKLAETLNELARKGQTGTPEYAELNRRFGWEFNGMRLHEYYFGNLAKKGAKLDRKSQFFAKVAGDFGSYENWEKDFKATGAMRGIGWTILYYEPIGQQLFNIWVDEHDLGHLSGAIPILVMDVFEHAYLTDYGLKRADYIEAFFQALDWAAIERRFTAALSQALGKAQWT